MKKLFIAATLLIVMVAGAMVLSSFSEPKENVMTECSDVSICVTFGEPQCVNVGNCTVELKNYGYGTYRVWCYNYNEYRVTVYYKVMGYDNNGNKREISGGSLNPKGKTNQAGFDQSLDFKTSCTNVYIDSDNLRVVKCD